MLNARMPKRDEVARLGQLEEELRLRLSIQAAGAAYAIIAFLLLYVFK